MASSNSSGPELSREEAYRLEQEPTAKNNLGVDCISRKSIKQKLQEHHDFFVNAYGGFNNLPLNDKSRVDEITNCIAMVVNEPPATLQEPRKGHWACDRANVRCSCCDRGYKDFYGKARIASYNYCPNCGAKMESEDQDD